MLSSSFFASANSISRASSSEKPSSMTFRVRHISISPLSTLRIISQFSSVPYFLRNMLFTTSCSTLSMYGRSIFFSSLKSLKESIRLILLIIYVIRYFLVNCYFRFRNFRKRDLRLNQAHLFTLIPDGLFQHHRLTGNLHQFPSTSRTILHLNGQHSSCILLKLPFMLKWLIQVGG